MNYGISKNYIKRRSGLVVNDSYPFGALLCGINDALAIRRECGRLDGLELSADMAVCDYDPFCTLSSCVGKVVANDGKNWLVCCYTVEFGTGLGIDDHYPLCSRSCGICHVFPVRAKHGSLRGNAIKIPTRLAINNDKRFGGVSSCKGKALAIRAESDSCRRCVQLKFGTCLPIDDDDPLSPRFPAYATCFPSSLNTGSAGTGGVGTASRSKSGPG